MCKRILAWATHLPTEHTGSMMKDEPRQSTDYSEKSHSPQPDTTALLDSLLSNWYPTAQEVIEIRTWTASYARLTAARAARYIST